MASAAAAVLGSRLTCGVVTALPGILVVATRHRCDSRCASAARPVQPPRRDEGARSCRDDPRSSGFAARVTLRRWLRDAGAADGRRDARRQTDHHRRSLAGGRADRRHQLRAQASVGNQGRTPGRSRGRQLPHTRDLRCARAAGRSVDDRVRTDDSPIPRRSTTRWRQSPPLGLTCQTKCALS